MKNIMALALGLFLVIPVYADEGMWLPLTIREAIYGDMKKLGLQLTPEQIYNVNGLSIKDAVVSLGGFCTGEIISRQGLLLTNHHCAESSIQSHSSVEHDYLKEGFWAQTMEDELPNPGLYARFLVRMEDVTKKVLAGVKDTMNETQRKSIVDAAVNRLTKEATEGSSYNADIKPVLEGNQYYLFVYETYPDVRLVGAPPGGIGYYGGETDNWTWPRHTGDFALFRVYMSPEGKPAGFSPGNIPLKPKHHLPISLKGYSEHDFSMILGFPGSTKRYATSFSLELAVNQTNPELIRIMDVRQRILREAMQKDEETGIQYHSKFFSISNALKYYRGQTQGIIDQQVIDKRRDLEIRFQQWADQRKNRRETYGNVLSNISQAYDQIEKYNPAMVYDRYASYLIESVSFSNSFYPLAAIISAENMQEQIDQTIGQIREDAVEFFSDYRPEIDEKVFSELLQLYDKQIREELRPVFLSGRLNFDAWADSVYNVSIFTDQARLMAFLDDPVADKLVSDPVYIVGQQLMDHYMEIRAKMAEAQSKLDENSRYFVKGLMEMQPEKQFYPDANSTMRLTYGTIQGYSPADGVNYNHYTTMAGLAAKDKPGNEEFDAPDKLIDLYRENEFNPYFKDRPVKLNFLSNNDITGGNSGSPVINASGELIGIAFDGNWEAMSSDIAYIPDLQRTISVDIRYVLLVIDKFAGASHLIDEMTLVEAGKETPVPARVPQRTRSSSN